MFQNLTSDEFRALVEEALQNLPDQFARKLQNVEVFVKDRPSKETIKKLKVTRDSLFGLYQGVPLKRKSVWRTRPAPDRITIFKQPLLKVSSDRENLRRRIRDVVIHEIAHHFGLTHAPGEDFR